MRPRPGSLRLYEDSRIPAVCRGCGALIDWYESATGGHFPIDAEAAPLRTVQDRATGRRIGIFAGSHLDSCPHPLAPRRAPRARRK